MAEQDAFVHQKGVEPMRDRVGYEGLKSKHLRIVAYISGNGIPGLCPLTSFELNIHHTLVGVESELLKEDVIFRDAAHRIPAIIQILR